MLVKALLFWNFFKSEMASLTSFNTSELINTSFFPLDDDSRTPVNKDWITVTHLPTFFRPAC